MQTQLEIYMYDTLLVWVSVKTAERIGAKFLWDLTDPRECLKLVKNEKFRLK